MSTKTTFKRIALVTVAALGFGMLSVAPSQATVPATSTISAASTTLTTRAGTAATTVLSLIQSISSSAHAYTITPTVVSQPSGAAIVAGAPAANKMAVTADGVDGTIFVTSGTTAGTIVQTLSTGVATYTVQTSAAAITTATAAGTASITPSLPGKYVIRYTVNSTTASYVDITVIALPVAASATTSLTATVSPSISVAATDTAITVVRNSAGVEADGNILGIVTSSSDSTDLPVGTVLGYGAGTSTTDLENNVATAAVSAALGFGTGKTFTFDNNLSSYALSPASTTLSGTYGFTFWVDTNANGVFDSGEVSTTASYTIVAALSANTGISVSIDNATRANSAGVSAFTVTATIADGSAATITESGTFDATNIIAGSSLVQVGTSNTYKGTFAVDADPAAGSDYEDITLTVTSGSYSNTATLRVVTLGELTAVANVPTVAITSGAGIGTVTDGVRQSLSVADYTTLGVTVDKTVTALTYTYTAATGQEGEYLKVYSTSSGITAATVAPATYSLLAIGADLTAKQTITAVSPAAADTYTATVTDGSGDDVVTTITYATATPAWSVSPSASFKAKFGDTMTVTGTLADQFGRALGAKAIYVSVTGRQAGTYNGTTATDGTYAFKWTDTNAATTVTLTDALTFNYPYFASATSTTTTLATSSSRTVTYSATGVAVGSVTVSAPSATTTRSIDQGAEVGLPRAASRVTYTATVKDAAGLPVVAGALVTFTGGADDLFYGGSTGVTDEFGQASVVVYRTKVGAPAIKATAGGVTSAASAAVQWTNDVMDGDDGTAAASTVASSAYRNARFITLAADMASVVSAGIIRFTATVTDRWGNAVAGAVVTFAETGAGRFYNPPASNQVTTNAAGEASIDLNSQAGETGAVSVTATLASSDSLATYNEDAENFVTVVSELGGTYTGTLTAAAGAKAAVKSAEAKATITKDTSTSTADALLALATALGTRDQASAAVDAAAEATDAANAATDAANAAAEAADAATAAAQDAADAVAALSTQVSEMVAALKKQITSLTNLVIKIQKKVKA